MIDLPLPALLVLWAGFALLVAYDLLDLRRLLRRARGSAPGKGSAGEGEAAHVRGGDDGAAPAAHVAEGEDAAAAYVDVVVPVYNMGDTVGMTLASVARSAYARRRVIVVDDGSTDGLTWPALQALEADLADTVVRIAHGGKSAAANHGARLGEGDFVLFLDADSRVSPDFIERTLATFARHPQIGAIDFVQRVANPEDSFWTRQATFERALLALQPDNFGALFAMRRHVFERFPFRDGLSPQFDVNARLHAAGLLRIDGQALVFSEEPRGAGLTFRRKRRWAYGFLEVQGRLKRPVDHHLLVPLLDLAYLASLGLAPLVPALAPFAPLLYLVWSGKALVLARRLRLPARDAVGYGVYMAVVNAAVAAALLAYLRGRRVVWR